VWFDDSFGEERAKDIGFQRLGDERATAFNETPSIRHVADPLTRR